MAETTEWFADPCTRGNAVFGRLTREYGGVRYPFGNFDRQRVVRDVEGVVSVPVYDNVVAVAALRVRVL